MRAFSVGERVTKATDTHTRRGVVVAVGTFKVQVEFPRVGGGRPNLVWVEPAKLASLDRPAAVAPAAVTPSLFD